ncbi:MAG: acetate--CoA ligase family protein [Candidatus Bathyarchaeota archaeon]|nr:acetate--CoA ligase family protein [Candidatus Bathyarchaeota archaeon]
MNKTSEIICQAYAESRKALLENEAKTICAEYNIPVTKFKLAKTVKESIEAAQQIGFPVVLKIVSPDIIHKSDSGGVMLNLKNVNNVKNAFNEIMDNVKRYNEKARILGVLVQEMAPSSIEVIIGAVKDPQFGQTLMFGLGGIFVEILKDVTFRVAPILKEDASEMINEIKAYPLLKGYRNTPPADIDALTMLLVNTSGLIMENPEIKELDLNPVIVYERGLKVVDTRIILE